MIEAHHHRMVEDAAKRAGRDLRGGSRPGRNTNRETQCEGGKAIATRREGHLFAEAAMQQPRNYQIEPE